MNADRIKEALKAAEELADEALGNGNDWELFCKPRLDLIRAALDGGGRGGECSKDQD